MKINKLIYSSILFIIFIGFSSSTYSQKPNEFNLRLHPLTLLDPINPALTIGGEYTINPEQSMITDIGLLYSMNPIETNTIGVNLQAEYREYLMDRTRSNHSTFLGGRGQYLFKQLTTSFDFIDSDSVSTGGGTYRDTIDISKTVYGFNFIIGYEYRYKKWSFQMFTGLGIKYKMIGQRNRYNSDDIYYNRSRDYSIYYELYRPGERLSLNLPLSFSVSIRL